MQCVVPNNGQLVLTTDSPDQCQGYLLMTSQEIAQLQPVWVPLSVTDGLAITASIVGCWALSYSIRMVRMGFLNSNGDSDA